MATTKREKKFWIRKDGLFYCAPVSLTVRETPLVRAIRTEPVGTYRAIGAEVFSVHVAYAAQFPEAMAARAAQKLGGVAELI